MGQVNWYQPLLTASERILQSGRELVPVAFFYKETESDVFLVLPLDPYPKETWADEIAMWAEYSDAFLFISSVRRKPYNHLEQVLEDLLREPEDQPVLYDSSGLAVLCEKTQETTWKAPYEMVGPRVLYLGGWRLDEAEPVWDNVLDKARTVLRREKP